MSQVTREEHNTPHIRHTGVASQAYSEEAVVIMTAKAGVDLPNRVANSRTASSPRVLTSFSTFSAIFRACQRMHRKLQISKCAAHLWVDWVGSETTDAGGVDAAGFSSQSELARRWGESALPGFSPEVYAVGHS